jgi:uncharacterized protein YdiU (UPF0061 family)
MLLVSRLRGWGLSGWSRDGDGFIMASEMRLYLCSVALRGVGAWLWILLRLWAVATI